MCNLQLFSELADKIRYYYVTVKEIQQDANNIQIYLKTNLITRSQLKKLNKALSPEYIMSDIDFSSKEITFERVSK